MRTLKFHSLNHEEGKRAFLEVALPADHPTPRMNENIKSEHAGFVAKTQFGLPTGEHFAVKGVLHILERTKSRVEISCLPITELQAMMQANGQRNRRPTIHKPGSN